jgi:hypothetical protein
MNVTDNYLRAICDEFNSGKKNYDKIIEMCKSATEVYSHSQMNLINTILYPESTMSVKYPSEWYRATATFRLTQTYTITPRDGKFFIAFVPGSLAEKSSGMSSLSLSLNGLDGKTTSIADRISSFLSGKGVQGTESVINEIRRFEQNSQGSSLNYLITGMENIFRNNNILSTQISAGDLRELYALENELVSGENLILNVPDNIIDTYRVNAAVIKVTGENATGVLYGATTYVNGNEDVNSQLIKYKTNFSNFSQEWVKKIEDNPKMGIRLIKTPKDNSDTLYRKFNQKVNNEQVILIAGKGIDPKSVLLVETIQHVEFTPVTDMLDFFEPTTPMFGVGSKEMLNKAISNFPLVGKSGGLIINSAVKMEQLQNYLKKYREAGYEDVNLWSVLTNPNMTNDEISNLLANTIY